MISNDNMLPVVIPCGGLGTRMGKLTENLQKTLLTVDGIPILHHLLRLLTNVKISQVVLLIEHLGEQVISYFKEHQLPGMNIIYIDSTGWGGSPHTLAVRGKVPIPFIQVAGNILFNASFLYEVSAESAKNPDVPIIVSTLNHKAESHLTVIPDESQQWIESTIRGRKRQAFEWEMMDIYVLTDKVFDIMEKKKISYCRALESLVLNGNRVAHLQYKGKWFHFETPEDIENKEAIAFIRESYSKYS